MAVWEETETNAAPLPKIDAFDQLEIIYDPIAVLGDKQTGFPRDWRVQTICDRWSATNSVVDESAADTFEVMNVMMAFEKL